MKYLLKIVSALIFLLTINISFASGTENKPNKSQQQEGQTLESPQKGERDQQELDEETDSYDAEEDQPESDSLEDDSVSKYNFIFYFLYKFKYEAEA